MLAKFAKHKFFLRVQSQNINFSKILLIGDCFPNLFLCLIVFSSRAWLLSVIDLLLALIQKVCLLLSPSILMKCECMTCVHLIRYVCPLKCTPLSISKVGSDIFLWSLKMFLHRGPSTLLYPSKTEAVSGLVLNLVLMERWFLFRQMDLMFTSWMRITEDF